MRGGAAANPEDDDNDDKDVAQRWRQVDSTSHFLFLFSKWKHNDANDE